MVSFFVVLSSPIDFDDDGWCALFFSFAFDFELTDVEDGRCGYRFFQI